MEAAGVAPLAKTGESAVVVREPGDDTMHRQDGLSWASSLPGAKESQTMKTIPFVASHRSRPFVATLALSSIAWAGGHGNQAKLVQFVRNATHSRTAGRVRGDRAVVSNAPSYCKELTVNLPADTCRVAT